MTHIASPCISQHNVESVQSQVGQGFEQRHPAKDVPARSKGVD